jgi:hypothetical protein
MAAIPLNRLREAGLMEAILQLGDADDREAVLVGNGDHAAGPIESMDVDSLVERALQGRESG